MSSYLVLFDFATSVTDARCALTAPFHPTHKGGFFCGLYAPQALPGTRLWSPDFSISRYFQITAEDSDYLVDSHLKPYMRTQPDSRGILALGIENLVVDCFFSQAKARRDRIC